MKVCVLYSGGKDSNYALFLASKYHEISCLITMISKEQNSYMFQSAGIDFTKLQSECLQIPQIKFNTKGEKEKELDDLKDAIIKAKEEFGIEGVVTGAINSIYQASRVQKICDELNLECFNPIWQKDQVEFLKELIEEGFEILIVGVFSYPLTSKYLGKKIDKEMILKLVDMSKKYQINPAGEGGELETFVVDSPIFKKRLEIKKSNIFMDSENSGVLNIEDIEILDKK